MMILLLPVVAYAHPETGEAPDGVAETEYRIALEMNPKDTRTRIKLGMILYRKNKLKDAERELSIALKKVPGDFDANYTMGLVRLKEKKYRESIAWFQQASRINSEDSIAYYGLGQALEQSGRQAEAESAYRKGLEMNERQIRTGQHLDHVMERKKNFLAALENLRRSKTTR